MDYAKLAELLFPDVHETPADVEKKYPPRALPQDAKVTRFAPSPTGFVHLGGLYQTIVGERLAHQSGGVFFLRIEDTDDKREIKGAAQKLISTLAHYGINFDEGAVIGDDGEIAYKGEYGPYKQSERGPIYRVYAKDLVRRGLAYPVFTTREELESLNAADKKAEVKSREWTEEFAEQQKEEMLARRVFTLKEVKEHLKNGDPFVLRVLASGDGERKVKCFDLIRGELELPENDRDEIILKSNGIPPYHFAHAVDDHLMGTTHVIRGEEWLASLPLHLQLFSYLGFNTPKYMHTAQVMSLDANGNKKKLSKRDMGASMDDYTRLGYAPEAVREYLLTVLNSNYEEWRSKNPDSPYTDFQFSIKKMSNSGCLIDFEKLEDISKNVLSRMTAEQICDGAVEWAREYDADFARALESDKAKAIA
ncbi:MAG: glutamate--tRNA ligase, partial [Clostridia bacterium]|nr:glutamate--tRNA ligase [Clostridia bacterium]